MKKLYLLASLAFASLAFGQIVNIPDANFKAILLGPSFVKNINGGFSKIDANDDGEIQVSEAEQVSELFASSASIKSLEGISYFTNLTRLMCLNNEITSLDLSKNTKLVDVTCESNPIAYLNLTGLDKLETLMISRTKLTKLNLDNPNLKTLYCTFNEITSIDTSKLINLDFLDCSYNKISYCDFTNNVNLKSLNLHDNNIKSLDLSKNKILRGVSCSVNKLESLDLSQNLDLKHLSCDRNQITNINIKENHELISLHCGTNLLTTLDLSNNTNLRFLYCNDNKLTFLDFSKNVNLEMIYCTLNKLKYINLKNGADNKSINLNSNYLLDYICCDESELEMLNTEKRNSTLKFSISATCNSKEELSTTDITKDIDFAIHPNPVKSILNIVSKDDIKQAEILDLQGRLLQSSLISNNKIEVDRLEKGTYLLKVKGKVVKFIKE